jgi:predicted Zn-dependent protease
MSSFGRLIALFAATASFLVTAAPLEAEIVQKCISQTAGFTIEFPPGWQIWEKPEDVVALIAFRPKEKADEIRFERLGVAFLEYTGEDPDAFLEKHIADLQNDLPDFALVSRGSEEFPGFSSRVLVYTFTDAFLTIKARAKTKQWIIRRNERIYLLTATATVESFPRYEEIFQEIVGSFQVVL